MGKEFHGNSLEETADWTRNVIGAAGTRGNKFDWSIVGLFYLRLVCSWWASFAHYATCVSTECVAVRCVRGSQVECVCVCVNESVLEYGCVRGSKCVYRCVEMRVCNGCVYIWLYQSVYHWIRGSCGCVWSACVDVCWNKVGSYFVVSVCM